MKAGARLPSYVGREAGSASGAVVENGWRVVKKTRVSKKAQGTVVAQTPRAGTRMSPGATVTLFIAKPPAATWRTIWHDLGRGNFETGEIPIPAYADGAKFRLKYSLRAEYNNVPEDLGRRELGRSPRQLGRTGERYAESDRF